MWATVFLIFGLSASFLKFQFFFDNFKKSFKILQSDNGLEFKNKTMIDLIKKWDGDCKCVYGRPKNPQSQGLIEQDNKTVENMIADILEQWKTKEWSKLLTRIQLNPSSAKDLWNDG